ncbi:MAG: hypothetical protein O6948_15365 [Deltaproteobacteria bacterium]|nr:hypothetical protein [Deltaproteobacteria bacterium]
MADRVAENFGCMLSSRVKWGAGWVSVRVLRYVAEWFGSGY